MNRIAVSASALVAVALCLLPRAASGEIVSYWDFNSKIGTTVLDRVLGSGHDGTLVGSADITSGGQGFGGGEALVLGADGDYLDIASPETFDFNSDFTWHARVQTSENSGAIFSRNPNGTAWNQGSKALFVRNRGGNGEVEWDTGWVSNPRTGTFVNDGQWHQIIATYNATTDALRVYVDPVAGTPVAQYDNTHNVNAFDEHTHFHNNGFAETSFTVGQADFSSGLQSLDALVGLIDDAAVFDTELTGAELNQLIAGGPASFTIVPEPSSIAIALLGLVAMALYAVRKRR